METSTQVMGNGEIRLTPGSAAKFAREVRAKTRCQFSAEDEIGIVLEACSAWFLPRIVGIPQSMGWALTGRVFSAQEALKGGLVSGVVPQDRLMPTAYELAREIADNTSALLLPYLGSSFGKCWGRIIRWRHTNWTLNACSIWPVLRTALKESRLSSKSVPCNLK